MVDFRLDSLRRAGGLLLVMAVFVIAFAVYVMSPTSLLGNSDMTKRDTLAVEMSFDLPQKITLNEPFDVAFNVTVLEPVPHANDSLDEIDVMLPSGCEIVHGEPYWQGMLSRGRSVSVKFRAKITEPTSTVFRGYVYSGYIPNKMRLFRTVNCFASDEFLITARPTADNDEGAHATFANPSRSRCLVLPPHDVLGVSANAETRVIPVEIIAGSVSPETVYQLDRTAVNALSFWLKSSLLAEPVRVIPQQWQLSCPLYDMALNADSTGTLLVDSQVDTTTLTLLLDGTSYNVRLQVSTTAPGNR